MTTVPQASEIKIAQLPLREHGRPVDDPSAMWPAGVTLQIERRSS